MNTEDAVDAEFEEISDQPVELTQEQIAAHEAELTLAKQDFAAATGTDDERPLTQAEMIAAVKGAVRDGVISSSKKAKFLREMGVFQSEFTKKKTSKSSKVNKRKAAKKARRKNRK